MKNSLRVYRDRRFVLPTPESPTRTTVRQATAGQLSLTQTVTWYTTFTHTDGHVIHTFTHTDGHVIHNFHSHRQSRDTHFHSHRRSRDIQLSHTQTVMWYTFSNDIQCSAKHNLVKWTLSKFHFSFSTPKVVIFCYFLFLFWLKFVCSLWEKWACVFNS